MQKGKIKSVFPGANSAYGFYSLYDNIIDKKTAKRVYIIKGGPGTGKSSFMRDIGETIRQCGYNIEHHHCSSDNNSLDAIVIPELAIALLDGTAPHIQDPVCPGATDEIINFLDYCDQQKLQANRLQIEQINNIVTCYFNIAYSSLKQAQTVAEEINGYYKEALINTEFNNSACRLLTAIFSAETEIAQRQTDIYAAFNSPQPGSNLVRHLFSSAICPAGHIHYIDSLTDGFDNLYLLKEECGQYAEQILKLAANTASLMGFSAEIYHSPIQPENYELLLIPQLKTALLRYTDTLYPDLLKLNSSSKIINLNHIYNQQILAFYKAEIGYCKNKFKVDLKRAIQYISNAKRAHDALEQFYIKAMKFPLLKQKKEKIIGEIINQAENINFIN